MKILRQTPGLARIISSGSITPISVEKMMEGRLISKFIYKTTKGLRESYKILRQQVMIHNKDPKNKKGTKVIAKAVRKVTQAQTDTTKYRQHYTNLHILLEYGCRKEGCTLSLTGIGLLRVSPPKSQFIIYSD